jgi:hypothetical protein
MPTKNDGLLALHASEVRPGQRWRHLKTNGAYTVIATGLDEATLTPVVIYAGGDGVVWVRTLAAFLGDTEAGKPRFILLEDERDDECGEDVQASVATGKFRRASAVIAGLRELAEACQ